MSDYIARGLAEALCKNVGIAVAEEWQVFCATAALNRAFAAGMERAIDLVRAEQLTDVVDNEGDRGYRNAIEDCERAIAEARTAHLREKP